MVCDKLASDAGMRSKGYYRDPNYKHQALARLTRDEESVRESISEGNYESLLSSAASLLKGNGYSLDTTSPEFKCFIELFTEGLAKVNKAVRERNLGNVTEEPIRPVSLVRNSLSNSEETDWDSLDKLKDYWLTQPAKGNGGEKSRTAIAEAENVIRKFKLMVGDLKPSEITKSHIVALKDKMLEAGTAPATINKSRGIFAAI